MFKRIAIILVSVLVASCAGSMKDIRITSFQLESVSPCGLREVNAVMNVNIDNPSIQFYVDDIKAVLKYGGEECMFFDGGRIDVDAKCSKSYRMLIHGQLSDSFNPFIVLNLLHSQDLGECTLDFEATGHAAGFKKKFTKKDIRINELLEKI